MTDNTQTDIPEESVEVAGPPAPVTTENAAEDAPEPEAADLGESYPKPKGAFLFVMLMMLFYVFYWTLSYFEIFVFRGA